MSNRHLSPIDKIILQIDQGIRTVFNSNHKAQRDYPGENYPQASLTDPERQDIIGKMRVNHSGEVCAQALYQGQAATARLDSVREKMLEASEEENDHLAWCEERLRELDSHPSYFNLIWYLGSYTIGAIAGIAGDRWSLGFVAETENQVSEHLQQHLDQLPRRDTRTRAILEQMKLDEEQHATNAISAGGADLPPPVKKLMRMMAKVMTRTAYYY